MNDAGLAHFATDVRYIVQHAANVAFGRMDDVFEELSQVSTHNRYRKHLHDFLMSAQMVSLLQSDTVSDFLDPDSRMLVRLAALVSLYVHLSVIHRLSRVCKVAFSSLL